MSGARSLAAAAAKGLFYASLLVLGVWLFWYGQFNWYHPACRVMRPAIPNGPPASLIISSRCALNWQLPLLQSNIGFLFLVPAVAALSAIAVIALREHNAAGSSKQQQASAVLQSWGSTLLPPKRLFLWLCDGLTVKDALVVAAWAVFNGIWYSAIISRGLAASPAVLRSPRFWAKSFASLMMPNLVILLFPVSRGSVINNALGLSYPEGIRYHRWLGQWTLLLVSLHGLMYWASWAVDGRWVANALRGGQDTNMVLGGVALICALLLWATSQEPVRRRWYSFYKAMHHFGFWGFMLMGVAHHWKLVWYFVPGMLLYAVDGVFRLHQMFVGRSGTLNGSKSTEPNPGCCGVNTEVVRVEVDRAGTMCSLLLSAPEFGAAPAGVVWLNVPQISLTQWHAFDYTASQVTVGANGQVASAYGGSKGMAAGKVKTVLSVHIKAYSRWTKSLVTKLAAGSQEELTIRLQGPYADPPVPIGQPDGVILVAGGNGIASALPVFEELSAAGVKTEGLPALLVWACRKGNEFEFMAAPVLAAAQALGLNLSVRLHVTDGAELARNNSVRGGHHGPSSRHDTDPPKDTDKATNTFNSTPRPLAFAYPCSTSSSLDLAEEGNPYAAAAADGGACGHAASSVAAPTSLCPVVAFASAAAQLSFRVIVHLAVFTGFMLGLFMALYAGATVPFAAGRVNWETAHFGPALVLIPAAFAVSLGLITLWIGLAIQRRTQGSNPGSVLGSGPASAIAAASGMPAQLLLSSGVSKSVGSQDTTALELQVPTMSGTVSTFPVVTARPSVSSTIQGWLNTQQQLPSSNTAKGTDGGSGRQHFVVYGCGPTPLDHSTQLAVASVAAKQRRRGEGAASPVLQFVRKAQML